MLIAKHAAEPKNCFIFPPIAPGLPRALATARPATGAELAAFAVGATFPVVGKNAEPWVRRRAPVVSHSSVLDTAEELLAIAPPTDVVQECIPREQAEDWFVHLYFDASSNCLLTFTGVKIRSCPPHAGATAAAYAAPNPALARLAERLCKEIGFGGIADLDWRLDKRDGQYKLVDFNPRVGNQFRLFEAAEGVDVVRALHVDLTGRPVPVGSQVSGRRIVVEHIDLPAPLSYRAGSGYASAPPVPRPASTELAWLARYDPLPFRFVCAAGFTGPSGERRRGRKGCVGPCIASGSGARWSSPTRAGREEFRCGFQLSVQVIWDQRKSPRGIPCRLRRTPWPIRS